ncbi:MAG: hypothetical protein ACLUFV_13030 [Acutalibacteraceae bacterium]
MATTLISVSSRAARLILPEGRGGRRGGRDGAEHEREFHVEPERDQRALYEKDGDHRLKIAITTGVKPTRLKYER